ncbi:hypothetical protein K466DRAFT_602343 [Polyporus arcularius HHB13444]|uniref:MYND-type domain-containing protein n=1 Tax=Polyporus arcularius HHB13444 TaxID=1314778 RepID=A0A5C3P5B5_9APHY|nr:hypothetical protein K466DRAFT_602343 [Polyporus arcularius HHB13444]
MKLLRCGQCIHRTYCSKECQTADWQDTHSEWCNEWYAPLSKYAHALSGDPSAWRNLVSWIEFHDTALLNAAIAQYVQMKAAHPQLDVTKECVLEVVVEYRTDPGLPAEKRFKVVSLGMSRPVPGVVCVAQPDLDIHAAMSVYRDSIELIAEEREQALAGERTYWGTGAYLILARFAPNTEANQLIPFWSHFNIDIVLGTATPACRNALDQLKEVLDEGKKSGLLSSQ